MKLWTLNYLLKVTWLLRAALEIETRCFTECILNWWSAIFRPLKSLHIHIHLDWTCIFNILRSFPLGSLQFDLLCFKSPYFIIPQLWYKLCTMYSHLLIGLQAPEVSSLWVLSAQLDIRHLENNHSSVLDISQRFKDLSWWYLHYEITQKIFIKVNNVSNRNNV